VNPDGEPVSSRTFLAVRLGLLLLAAAGVCGSIYVLSVVPPTEDTYYPRCQFHSCTGLHCPGCGTTRALNAALNGCFAQALAYNALAFIVLPVLGWSLFRSLQTWYFHRPATEISSSSGLLTRLLVILVLAFGVIRNLPWFPFTVLAPHEL
jgi:hypothetical protein